MLSCVSGFLPTNATKIVQKSERPNFPNVFQPVTSINTLGSCILLTIYRISVIPTYWIFSTRKKNEASFIFLARLLLPLQSVLIELYEKNCKHNT